MSLRPLLVPLTAVAAIVALPSAAYAAGSIRVTVSPGVLLADGISSATVSAEIRTTSGRPARDGTEVRFYTTAGTITQVAFTQSGIARATLTSSAVPQAANISVSAGLDQTVVTVPMVSKLVEANVGGRVMKIEGKYVAFSEDKRFIQADQQVRIRFRGVQIEANSIQIDLNADTVKALGKVAISSDDQTILGERAWLSLKSFEGYIVAVGTRRWFSGYGLTDLPEKPKNLNPDFELEDLSDSKLLWVGKQANYVYGERVQVQSARAYVGGIKSIRMPFHQASLREGIGETHQYVGVGSEGLTLDLPLYVRMTPNATTAFRVGFGDKSGGIGQFTRNRGLNVDLVQKYGFAGASEGEASLTNLTSPDRIGLNWNHTQQFGKNTRLVTQLQFPQHRDLYGQVNLTQGMSFGTVHLAASGNQTRRTGFGRTLSFGFESKPKPVLNDKAALTFSASAFDRTAGEARIARGIRVPVRSTQQQAIGVNLRPRTQNLGAGFTLDSRISLRGVRGGLNEGFGPAFETQIRRALPNNGFVGIGVNYNQLATINDLVPTQGRLNTTLHAVYPVTSRFRISALANMALDAESRNSLITMSYQLAPKWRFDLLHTFYRFGTFGDYDYQLGISRSLGNRELGLYWSRRDHRFIIEFGATRF